MIAILKSPKNWLKRLEPSSDTPAQIYLSLSLLWALLAAVVLLFMLFAAKYAESLGFPISLDSTFFVFNVSAVAFFLFVPPVFITPEGDPDATSVTHILLSILLIALVTIPFLLVVRRITYIEKTQLTAILSLLTVYGLSSALFYSLFPRLHFFFFSAISLGFPFFHMLLAELFGLKGYYMAGFSPFVTVYSITPDTAMMKIGYGWGNAVATFGLIAFVCLAYIILWSKPKEHIS